MVRPIEQIQRDLDRLEQAAQSLATDLSKAYHEYLSALSQAVRQQLIMASYHICTQDYPEQFLRLSTNQRYQIQQELRELAHQTQEQLLSLPSKLEAAAHRLEMKRAQADILAQPGAGMEQSEEVQGLRRDPEVSSSVDGSERQTADLEISGLTQDGSATYRNGAYLLPIRLETHADNLVPNEQGDIEDLASEDLASKDTYPKAPFFDQPKRPLALLQWQQGLEAGIGEVLRMASRKANQLFQAHNIMPRQFPGAMLEAAAKSDAADSGIAGAPNLLHLVMEPVELSIPDADEANEQEGGMTREQREALQEAVRSLPPLRITAIHLRLSEVEFASATVMAHRSTIRELLLRLKNLERSYQKWQSERAIAEAEAAWRASWVDE